MAAAAAPSELWRYALAVSSGLLLFLSFPKFGHPASAWLALAPLLLGIHGTRPGRAARLGYVTGVVFAVGLLYWTAFVVVQYGGLHPLVGGAVLLALALAFASFEAIFGWALGRACAAFGTAGLLAAPVLWVGTEILRAHTLFRFPWCLLGYSQFGWLLPIQIADLAGVYGVSFVLASTSAVLAFTIVEHRRGPRRMAALGLTLLIGATLAYGAVRLRQPMPESGRIRVGLVQASIAQDEKWNPDLEMQNLERHLALSRSVLARKPSLLVWPESSVPFYFDYEPVVADPLRALTRASGSYLIFGNDDAERRPGDIPLIWVGAKMLAPDGALAYRYHKNRLVPFGEYVPMKALFTLGGRIGAHLVRQVGEFTPGAEANVARLDGHSLGTFICYEAIFPDLVRQFSRNGAELLVNITNDGWYGTTSAPYQHFSMATFRAVENRKWLVRAANTGISAFVDPYGRVVRGSKLFDRTVVVGEAAFVPGVTVYARVGDAFAWACLGLSVATVAFGFRRRSH